MKRNNLIIVVLLVIALMLIAVTSCSGSNNKTNLSVKTDNNPVVSGKNTQITDNGFKTDDVIMDWDVELKGYNVVKPPATLTLSIMRVNQPNAGVNAIYKYQINEGQPWIDVSTQVNAVGFREYCDIPLNFTTPGKYWITTKIFYDDGTDTGLYNTDFVIILEPEK